MKALSLTQPYAELIKNGTKTIETRSWETDYRGIIYIHASSTKIPKEIKNNTELMSLTMNKTLDYGMIICSCNLVDCIKMTADYIQDIKLNHYKEYVSGVYSPGRYAWVFNNIKVLDNPFKIKGHLGLWNFEHRV